MALDVSIEANAGGAPFSLGSTLRSSAGVDYSVSMLRFYLSHIELVDDRGRSVPAVLADAGGDPLQYGVTLVDFAKPESLVLHLLAEPGSYTSLSVGVGVPEHCEAGGLLNHENASEQSAPLDVDADMYWGWNPGYVFLKIEGRANTLNGPRPFLFHVGDDRRYVTATMPAAVDVSNPAPHHVAVDINRLFTTPSGDTNPDMTGVATSNIVHGGREADAIATNLADSEVFQWSE